MKFLSLLDSETTAEVAGMNEERFIFNGPRGLKKKVKIRSRATLKRKPRRRRAARRKRRVRGRIGRRRLKRNIRRKRRPSRRRTTRKSARNSWNPFANNSLISRSRRTSRRRARYSRSKHTLSSGRAWKNSKDRNSYRKSYSRWVGKGKSRRYRKMHRSIYRASKYRRNKSMDANRMNAFDHNLHARSIISTAKGYGRNRKFLKTFKKSRGVRWRTVVDGYATYRVPQYYNRRKGCWITDRSKSRLVRHEGGTHDGGSGSASGPGGSSGCFIAGTSIIMSDKTTKNIEDVKVNDLVLAFDEETEKQVSAKVLEIENPKVDTLYILNKDLLTTTIDHPIYITKPDGTTGWASFDPDFSLEITPELEEMLYLELGDSVQLSDGNKVKITNIEMIERDTQTYNLSLIEKVHTFYAANILVHNKGAGGGGGGG